MDTEEVAVVGADPASALTALTLLAIICIAYHAQRIWRHREHGAVEIGTMLWNLAFLGLLGFLGSWAALGLIEEPEGSGALAACTNTLFFCGVATLARGPLARLIDRLSPQGRAIACLERDALAIVVAAVLSNLALETAWNDNAAMLPFSSTTFSVLIVGAAMLFAYFLFQRNGVGPALIAVICCGLGIAQHFISAFKGTAILPSDLLALGTAAAVGDQYTFTLNELCVQAIGLGSIALALLSLVRAPRIPLHGVPSGDVRRAAEAGEARGFGRGQADVDLERIASWLRARVFRIANVAANLLVALAIALGVNAWFTDNKVEEVLEIGMSWLPVQTYQERGWIPSFAVMLQRLPIPTPKGYSDETAEADEAELAAAYDEGRGASEERAAAVAQFNEVKPTVIAVMNESFSDLSLYNGLNMGYTGPAFYNSLADTLQRGTLDVSVVGGGTCNSEFEFLTGNSMAFIGEGKYPYLQYDFTNVATLPRAFKELGYSTTAIHPQAPTNWNRDVNYRRMGFDEFLSYDDIAAVEGAWNLHSGLTDGTTYTKILELLSEDDSPQFIFDVTMQNHGGYDSIDVPEDLLYQIAPEAITDEALRNQLTEYISCIQGSDRDLEAFIGELEQLDRPIVLVFFGDHQPSVAVGLNDYLFSGEDDQAHAVRTHLGTYMIWANYDVAGTGETAWAETGAAQLGAQVLDRIGAPLSLYDRAKLGAGTQVAALNINGYLGADGIRYGFDAESAYSDLVERWQRVQYLEFGSKVQ